MKSSFEYRLKTQGDDAALQRLWTKHSGWGDVNEGLWQRLLGEPPHGKTLVVVAEDSQSGEIVGQIAFARSKVLIEGQQVDAARAFVPILAESARQRHSFDLASHPIASMYRIGVEELQSTGTVLIYTLPNRNWLMLLRLLPDFRFTTFPSWTLPLSRSQPLTLPEGFTAGPVKAWDDRIDALWSASSRLHDCLVVRDSRALAWKTETFRMAGTEVRKDGELNGLVTTVGGKERWVISTVLMVNRDEALRAAIVAGCNVARAEWLMDETASEQATITVLATTDLQPALSDLGFAYNGYDHPLAIHTLEPSIDERRVEPEGWYVAFFD